MPQTSGFFPKRAQSVVRPPLLCKCCFRLFLPRFPTLQGSPITANAPWTAVAERSADTALLRAKPPSPLHSATVSQIIPTLKLHLAGSGLNNGLNLPPFTSSTVPQAKPPKKPPFAAQGF